MITILDYGMGNLRSVQKAVEHLGSKASISSSIVGSEKLIIPGVGAFAAAMAQLGTLKPEIQRFASSGQPLMGICLGQQLLFESSEEGEPVPGLEILEGRVRELPKDAGLKVPHVGWSELQIQKKEGLLSGIDQGSMVYFVHSFYTDLTNRDDAAAVTDYGLEFASAIQHENIWATQFHPEKSGEIGLKILENFIKC